MVNGFGTQQRIYKIGLKSVLSKGIPFSKNCTDLISFSNSILRLTKINTLSFGTLAALDIFKRTSSVTKLQKAMGHSSLKVSLTYLRGLEVPELTEEDMPQVQPI